MTTLSRSLAPGASIAPGSFHDGSAATSHPSAASAYNLTRSTAPYLARSASQLSASAHTSGTGSFAVSGRPATPGTTHQSIGSVVNAAAGVFSPAGTVSPAYASQGSGSFFLPHNGGLYTPPQPSVGPVVGRIPDNVHVSPGTPQPTGPSSNNSGGAGASGSNNGNQNYGSSPQGTLESGQLGNLLYALLGPAGTGVTPGDAGLQVTPVSPTTTTTGPNVMVGLLALGALAGIGWYYVKHRKKGGAE